MKIKDFLPWFIVAGLCLFIYIDRSKEVVVDFVVPERINEKVITSPTPLVLTETRLEGGEIKVVRIENKVNDLLLQAYNSAKDSLEQLKLFKEAITERSYKEQLIDSIQTITVESDVIGTLTRQKIYYKTNPVKYQFKTKEPRKEFYLGAITTLPLQPNSTPSVGAQILMKNKSKLFNLGYDTNKNIIFGVSFNLLKK